jgi:hypothetical protein
LLKTTRRDTIVSELMTSGTGAGFVAFLQWTAERGVLAAATANAYRSAATKVLEVEADPDAVDVTSIDVEDLLDRFARLRGGNYTPDSLATYKTRFRKGLEYYLTYLKDPGNFRPRQTIVVKRNKKTGRVTSVKKKAAVQPSDEMESELRSDIRASTSTLSATDEIFQYPFRLRSGQTAYLHLPPQLDRSDVDRLIRLLESLVMQSETDGESAAG